MKPAPAGVGLVFAAVVLALLACGGGEKKVEQAAQSTATTESDRVEHMDVGEYVNPEDSLPRIRYFESGLVSLNERCPVRKVRLGRKMPPAWINGHPVGFC